MDLEIYDDIVEKLSLDYGFSKKRIYSYLETILTLPSVNPEDTELVSECLERVVSERSSVYYFYNYVCHVNFLATLKKAFDEVFGQNINHSCDSMRTTIAEDEFLAQVKLNKLL